MKIDNKMFTNMIKYALTINLDSHTTALINPMGTSYKSLTFRFFKVIVCLILSSECCLIHDIHDVHELVNCLYIQKLTSITTFITIITKITFIFSDSPRNKSQYCASSKIIFKGKLTL